MNSKESLIYTKYKTISMLPEEIMEAYCDKMTIEKIEALYEKVKQRFLELPEEDAQMQLELMGQFLQSMLTEKSITVDKAFHQWKKGEYSRNSTSLFANYAIALQKTGNYEKAFELFKMARDAGYPESDVLVETHEIGKIFYESKIKELMHQAIRTYSENYKVDVNTLKRVRKYFMIPEKVEIIGFFDYTVFGCSREGIAVTSDGIYFKTLMPKVMCIKWYELFKFDMEYKNCIQLKEKKGNGETIEICFHIFLDATKFMGVMKEMQNL